jgi:hypothetical protein
MERHAGQSKTNQGISLKYSTDITIPFGQLQAMIEWCENHCADDWSFNLDKPANYKPWQYVFEFENEKDYATFCLWKK